MRRELEDTVGAVEKGKEEKHDWDWRAPRQTTRAEEDDDSGEGEEEEEEGQDNNQEEEGAIQLPWYRALVSEYDSEEDEDDEEDDYM